MGASTGWPLYICLILSSQSFSFENLESVVKQTHLRAPIDTADSALAAILRGSLVRSP